MERKKFRFLKVKKQPVEVESSLKVFRCIELLVRKQWRTAFDNIRYLYATMPNQRTRNRTADPIDTKKLSKIINNKQKRKNSQGMTYKFLIPKTFNKEDVQFLVNILEKHFLAAYEDVFSVHNSVKLHNHPDFQRALDKLSNVHSKVSFAFSNWKALVLFEENFYIGFSIIEEISDKKYSEKTYIAFNIMKKLWFDYQFQSIKMNQLMDSIKESSLYQSSIYEIFNSLKAF